MILLSALLMASQAAGTTGTADPWRPLGETASGIHVSYDPTPAARDGDTVTVRLMMRHPPSESGLSYSLSTAEIRCREAQLRVIRTLSFATDGRQIAEDVVPMPFEAIPAGSFVNVVRQAVC